MDTQSRITLAAGMVKTVEDVERVLRLPIDEITVGSITKSLRPGNKEPHFYTDGSGNYWNAIGLKNGGEEYYATYLPQMHAIVKQAGRTLITSISGDTPEENADLVALVSPYADIIEWNTACPNAVTEDGGRKPLIGYSILALHAHLDAILGVRPLSRLRIKVPPYTDLELLKAVAALVNVQTTRNTTTIVATNTLPGCLPLDDEDNECISVGLAGGSGAQLHTLAVGNVKKWREFLRQDIPVVGAGGIREAVHARNFERVGAAGCEMAGAFYHEGEKAFQHVLQGLYA